ncbi:hypothetical protein PSHT_14581 [Puccinia striiformis]|uniref:Uncharacterized protein n=1 Tax=Puccinia striiformis TaxID=27350 RepID=A0A2S4UJP0_9BASI|nr:hypothetical protein PSHT_14581 [Puccinia striiformis]
MVISPLPQIFLDRITFCHGTSYLPNLQTSPSFIFNAKKKPVPIYIVYEEPSLLHLQAPPINMNQALPTTAKGLSLIQIF